MKRGGIRISMQVLLMMILTAMLAVGCAKKPAPVPVTTDDQAAAQQAVQGVEEMGAGETGIGESMIGEESMDDSMSMPQTVASLERIYFNFDRYDLSPEAQAILINNAEYLKANPDQKVRIEGYCDERGSDEYNLALGERRALAAQKYLESLGVAGDRLSVISYGEEMPLDPAQNEDAYAMNRRAEFKSMP
ncbi:peptidoglycan-binding outer membrane lipoprotein Pal, OmpA family [Syntrophotalea carbinolica DSM 2380]|uniref:Peptidoglycan-associated lipoprotein n=1 Tax=Syntrophotalea carbinolica (strain DSM 2380 / NBRC 103641 / GraBd1) TaxID=338963 RepID=Q3A098_SYNC1|nr:peptidoglycan-associated lipoprotein Pal [Syntrophotalea carbinolica]ABA90209.1 peptidoglycan-binding outer membrane lipoprotein Pal, OmpA family [Syntrophotalea carbinolica DSM 2380]